MKKSTLMPHQFEPLAREIEELHQARAGVLAELATTRQKAADADADRDELQQSDQPGDDEVVRRLTAAQVRSQLYVNHLRKLEARLSEIMVAAAKVTAALAREERKAAVQFQAQARREFVRKIAAQVTDGEVVVQNAVAFLRPHTEVLAMQLDGHALGLLDSRRVEDDPFHAWDSAISAWDDFVAAAKLANPK